MMEQFGYHPIIAQHTFATPQHARVYALLGEILEILDAEWDAWSVSSAKVTISALEDVRSKLWMWRSSARRPDPTEATRFICAGMMMNTPGSLADFLTAKTIRRPTPPWNAAVMRKPAPATLTMGREEVKKMLCGKLAAIITTMQELAKTI